MADLLHDDRPQLPLSPRGLRLPAPDPRRRGPQPFRFVDVGCGDATEIVAALRGTRIARYHGIDLSHAALDQVGPALAALDCPVTPPQRDFVEALREGAEPADVVWIGLSLHHFQTRAKLPVMRAIRGIVGERGLLLIWDRAGWMRRWDEQQPAWIASERPALAGDPWGIVR